MKTLAPPILRSMRGLPCCSVRITSAPNMLIERGRRLRIGTGQVNMVVCELGHVAPHDAYCIAPEEVLPQSSFASEQSLRHDRHCVTTGTASRQALRRDSHCVATVTETVIASRQSLRHGRCEPRIVGGNRDGRHSVVAPLTPPPDVAVRGGRGCQRTKPG